MPDPILFLKASIAAAMVAAMMVLSLGWPWRTPHPVRSRLGYLLGIGLGFYVGCWVLGATIPWPLPGRMQAQDRDRLLLVLMPVVILAELLAIASGKLRRLAWPLRAIVAISAARILLDNSSYIADLAGPGTSEWTTGQAVAIFSGLAIALAVVWGAMGKLADRSATPSLPLALSIVCAGAAITVLLSGYASGGQLALPLSASLVGATIASLFLQSKPSTVGAIGVGTVGLFAILVVGRFYGTLTTLNAALLFGGLLLAWLPEWLPRFRGFARIALVAVPVTIALVLAGQKFAADSATSSSEYGSSAPSTAEPSLQDYFNFKK